MHERPENTDPLIASAFSWRQAVVDARESEQGLSSLLTELHPTLLSMSKTILRRNCDEGIQAARIKVWKLVAANPPCIDLSQHDLSIRGYLVKSSANAIRDVLRGRLTFWPQPITEADADNLAAPPEPGEPRFVFLGECRRRPRQRPERSAIRPLALAAHRAAVRRQFIPRPDRRPWECPRQTPNRLRVAAHRRSRPKSCRRGRKAPPKAVVDE
jgi:hypothetical protein